MEADRATLLAAVQDYYDAAAGRDHFRRDRLAVAFRARGCVLAAEEARTPLTAAQRLLVDCADAYFASQAGPICASLLQRPARNELRANRWARQFFERHGVVAAAYPPLQRQLPPEILDRRAFVAGLADCLSWTIGQLFEGDTLAPLMIPRAYGRLRELQAVLPPLDPQAAWAVDAIGEYVRYLPARRGRERPCPPEVQALFAGREQRLRDAHEELVETGLSSVTLCEYLYAADSYWFTPLPQYLALRAALTEAFTSGRLATELAPLVECADRVFAADAAAILSHWGREGTRTDRMPDCSACREFRERHAAEPSLWFAPETEAAREEVVAERQYLERLDGYLRVVPDPSDVLHQCWDVFAMRSAVLTSRFAEALRPAQWQALWAMEERLAAAWPARAWVERRCFIAKRREPADEASERERALWLWCAGYGDWDWVHITKSFEAREELRQLLAAGATLPPDQQELLAHVDQLYEEAADEILGHNWRSFARTDAPDHYYRQYALRHHAVAPPTHRRRYSRDRLDCALYVWLVGAQRPRRRNVVDVERAFEARDSLREHLEQGATLTAGQAGLLAAADEAYALAAPRVAWLLDPDLYLCDLPPEHYARQYYERHRHEVAPPTR